MLHDHGSRATKSHYVYVMLVLVASVETTLD